jgi:hypothetical protein
MSYSDLDPQNFYSDDPVELGLEKTKKKFSSLLVLILFAVAGTFFIQNTLAANISLNSGGPVEFGQGITQTVACSGATNLTITPSSTFTNASGAGSYKFNSITVSNIPEGCHGSDFTISAYGNTDNSPLALFNSTSTSAVIYNNAGNFEPGAGSTGMSVTSGLETFTATFTVPVALASSIFKITIQSGAHAVATCAQGGPCIVGDRGPGGGIVFYASASNFTSAGSTCDTTCKYLEVAPSTWRSGTVADDSFYIWSTDTTTLTVQNKSTASSEGFNSNEKLNWKIGQGFYNTSVMKVAGATSPAQAAVLAYAGNSTAGQWFIPSMNELNELCKYVRGQSTGNPKVACVIGSGTFKSTANAGTDLGGFVVTDYWSSSEHPLNFVWAQSFGGNYQGLSSKDNTSYSTRPVRAF